MNKMITAPLIFVAGTLVALSLTSCTSDGTQDIATPPPAAPTDTTAAAIHSTPTATDTTSVGESNSSRSTPLNPPGELSRDDANVDARDYQQGDTFYFQSPDGNYTCAVRPLDDRLTGCFGAIHPTPSQLSDCATMNSASIVIGGYLCQTQGVMTGEGGGAVLPYGSVLVVQSVICTSEPTGIACDHGGHGFSISNQYNTVY